MNRLRRRITALALAATLPSPSLVRSQSASSSRTRTIGLLLEGDARPVNTLKQLAQLGYVEDRNLRVIVRPVHVPPNETELDEAAKALVDSGAEVLVGYDTRAVLALHKATKRIPIVAGGVSNPVRLGLAKSLRTPGGNVTGLSFGLEESAMLQLKALRLLRPKLKHMMVLISPKDRFVFPENEWAGKEIGVQAEDVVVDDLAAADRILASVRDPAAEAAWVDQFVPVPTQEVAATAIKHRIATHGFTPQAVREGLLLSYWLHHPEAITRLASMIDKVLRGTDPGTLPFELPSAAELAINRNTARAIGVTIPEELTLRATEIVG